MEYLGEEIAMIKALGSLEKQKEYIRVSELKMKDLISLCKKEDASFVTQLLKISKAQAEEEKKQEIIKEAVNVAYEPKEPTIEWERTRKEAWLTKYYLSDFEREVRKKKGLYFTTNEEAQRYFNPKMLNILRLINHNGIKKVMLKASKYEPAILYEFKTFESNYSKKNGYTYTTLDSKEGKPEVHWWFEGLINTDEFTYYHVDWIPYPPTKDDPTFNTDMFNLFQGFKCKPIEKEKFDYSEIQPILDHIKIVWANGNEEYYKWILNWIGYLCQKPTERLPMLSILGKEGSGKTLIFEYLIDKIFGSENCATLNNLDEAVRKFNAIVAQKFFVYIAEMKGTGEDHHVTNGKMDSLKSKITDALVTIEKKGRDPYNVTNYLHWGASSNNEHPFNLGNENRRHQVFGTSDSKVGDTAYFTELHKYLTDKSAPHFYLFFLNMPTEPIKILETDAIQHIKHKSKKSTLAFIDDLQSGDFDYYVDDSGTSLVYYLLRGNYKEIVFVRHNEKTQMQDIFMCKKKFYNMYKQYCRDCGIKCMFQYNNFCGDMSMDEIRVDDIRCYKIFSAPLDFKFHTMNELNETVTNNIKFTSKDGASQMTSKLDYEKLSGTSF